MKKNTHPKYQEILFVDSATGQKFITRSTLQPTQTAKHEGKEYPVFPLSTSSYSHPFFTGSNKLVDSEGRVDKFKKRYAAAAAPKPAKEEQKEEPKAKKGKK